MYKSNDSLDEVHKPANYSQLKKKKNYQFVFEKF